MHRTVKKMGIGELIFQIVLGVVFGAFALMCVYPLYYVIINSVSDNRLVELGTVMWRPIGFHLQNYKYMLEFKRMYRAAAVSVGRTLIGTASNVLCTSLCAYLFTRQEIPGRKFWYRFTVVTMYFGAGMIPHYLMLRSLGLLDNFLVYIVPGLLGPYNMILIKTYMESIPASLEESAMMDGAGYMKRFIAIIFPLSKPIVASIAIFGAVGHWNSYMDTVLYITKPELHTLQYVLYRMIDQVNIMAAELSDKGVIDEAMKVKPLSLRYATTVVVTVPILFVYPFAQKYFASGIMIGSVKG